MDDQSILHRISSLVEREHELRGSLQSGAIGEADEHRELRSLEEELDQCWDLLRQRRAKREFQEDADEADPRPAAVVESYWQ